MSELTLSASEIAAAITKGLEGYTPSVEARTVGRVAEIGDGIARVSGLPDCAVNELLEFEDGSVGLALNLDEDSIGVVVLGDADGIEEQQTVKATGRILSVPVGDAMLGRVVNALGVPIAAGVLYPWTGLLLPPMIAALAMSLSSVSVLGNALRLRG